MLQEQFAALGVESDAERIAREAKEALTPDKPIEIIQMPAPKPASAVVEPIQATETKQLLTPTEPEQLLTPTEPVQDITPTEPEQPLQNEGTSKLPTMFKEALANQEKALQRIRNRPVYSTLPTQTFVVDKADAVFAEKETEESLYDMTILQAIGGVRDAFEQVSEGVEWATDYDPYDLPEVKKVDHWAGQTIRLLTQFTTGYAMAAVTLGATGITGAVGAGATAVGVTSTAIRSIIGQGALSGIGATLAISPDEPRISHLLKSLEDEEGNPRFQSELLDWLATDPNDSRAHKQAALAFEESVLGVVAVGGFEIVKGVTKFVANYVKRAPAITPPKTAPTNAKQILEVIDSTTATKKKPSLLSKLFQKGSGKTEQDQMLSSFDKIIRAGWDTNRYTYVTGKYLHGFSPNPEDLIAVKKGKVPNKLAEFELDSFEDSFSLISGNQLLNVTNHTQGILGGKGAVPLTISDVRKGFGIQSSASGLKGMLHIFEKLTGEDQIKATINYSRTMRSAFKENLPLLQKYHQLVEEGMESKQALESVFSPANMESLITKKGVKTFIGTKLHAKGISWADAIDSFRSLKDFDEIHQAAFELSNLNHSLARFSALNGVKSHSEVDAMIRANPMYVDLKVDPSAFTSVTGKQAAKSMKLLGDNEYLELGDGIESMVKNVMQTTTQGLANRTFLAFTDSIDKAIKAGTLATREMVDGVITTKGSGPLIAQKIEAVTLSGKGNNNRKLLQALQERASAIADDLDDVYSQDPRIKMLSEGKANLELESLTDLLPVLTRKKSLTIDGMNIRTVIKDGKAEFWQIHDPDMLRWWTAAGGGNAAKFLRELPGYTTARTINKLKQEFLTSDPAFASIAFTKDNLGGAVFSPFFFIPFVSGIKGLVKSYTDKALYQEALEHGMTMMSRTHTQGLRGADDLSEMASKKIIDPQVKRMYRGMWNKFLHKGYDGWRNFLAHVENSVRFSDYSSARKHGFTPSESVVFGQNVSVNFFKHGENQMIRSANDLTPFFNASMQGFHRAGQRMYRAPVKSLAIAAGVYAGIELNMDSLLRDKFPKEYSGLQDHQKDAFIHFPILENIEDWPRMITDPDFRPKLDPLIPLGGIPKPHEISVIGTLLTQANRAFETSDFNGLIGALQRSFTTMTPNMGLPSVIAPFVQIGLNRDHFGRPIMPTYMLDDKVWADATRASPYSSDLAYSIANLTYRLDRAFLQPEGKMGDSWVSPVVLDFIGNSFAVGIAGFVPAVIEATYDLVGESRGDRPTPSQGAKAQVNLKTPMEALTSIPVWMGDSAVRRFLIDPDTLTENINFYYDMATKFKRVTREDGSLEKAYRDSLPDSEEKTRLENISTTFKDMNLYMATTALKLKDIQFNPFYTSTQKTKWMRVIKDERRTRLYRWRRQFEKNPANDVLLRAVGGTIKAFVEMGKEEDNK